MHIAYMVPYDGLWGHNSLQTASEATSDNRLEISDLTYLLIHVHIAYMVPYDGLWGYYSLQTASEVKSDLRFKISDLNYIHIREHITYMVWSLLAASEATTASR